MLTTRVVRRRGAPRAQTAAPEPEDPKLSQLLEMGFEKDKARKVLNDYKGDVAAALEALLTL